MKIMKEKKKDVLKTLYCEFPIVFKMNVYVWIYMNIWVNMICMHIHAGIMILKCSIYPRCSSGPSPWEYHGSDPVWISEIFLASLSPKQSLLTQETFILGIAGSMRNNRSVDQEAAGKRGKEVKSFPWPVNLPTAASQTTCLLLSMGPMTPGIDFPEIRKDCCRAKDSRKTVDCQCLLLIDGRIQPFERYTSFPERQTAHHYNWSSL